MSDFVNFLHGASLQHDVLPPSFYSLFPIIYKLSSVKVGSCLALENCKQT